MNFSMPWFEIPVADIERAAEFYATLFQQEFKIMEAMGMKTAFLPIDHQKEGTGGSLTQGEAYQPGSGGTIIYLQVSNSLEEALGRVKDAGGQTLLPAIKIPDGYMAHFEDSEGNRMGLYSKDA